nr:MAG TPA: Regulatory protein [Caudoviricetes sp.]
MSYGKRVFDLRKQLNLTLEKFGEPLGVTKTAISNVLREKSI